MKGILGKGLLVFFMMAGLAFLTGLAIADVDNGKTVYEKFCMACHGVKADGTPVGPALRGEKAEAGEMREAVRQGKQGMPAFPANLISDADLDDLSKYVQALAAGGALPAAQPTPQPPTAATTTPGGPALAAAGQPLFDRYCAICHGPAGKGTPAGPALNTAAFAQEFNTADKIRDVTRQGTSKGMPAFAATQISDTDLAAVVAYIQSLAAAPAVQPTALPVTPTTAPRSPTPTALQPSPPAAPTPTPLPGGLRPEQLYFLAVLSLAIVMVLVMAGLWLVVVQR